MWIPIDSQIANRTQAVGNCVLGNHFAVDANALAKRDEVRGCERDRSDIVARDRSNRSCTYGAFAICAGDVDHFAKKGDLQIAHGGLAAAAP